MAFRNELKFYISTSSARLLESRLSCTLASDPHYGALPYLITSLYFDDPHSSAWMDKVNGTEKRSKFRIRYYNGSTDFLRLEKKRKVGALSEKTSASIDLPLVNDLLSGNVSAYYSSREPLRELAFLIREKAFRPVVNVEYQRRAFLYPAGNVRITLDSAVTASLYRGSFQDSFSAKVPVLDAGETILEVKYDSFLPPHLSELLSDIPRVNCAISKYAKCREIFL